MTTSFSERLTKWSRGALVVPATIVVLILVVMPLGIMLRYSLNRFDPSLLMIEALSLENYVRFFSDPFYRQVMITTVGIASVSTFICLVLGFPAAYAITRVRSERLKGALILMVVVPLFMGNAVRTTGWMVLLGDHGLLNEAMMSSGLIREPVHILYTFRAVLIGLVSVLLPYMIIAMQTVLDGINPAIEDAACSLGASWTVTAWRIVIPMAMPGIYAGASLCFILGMNAYATPVLIGGPTFHMMAPKIFEQITKASNWPFGAALAFILMIVTLMVTVLSSFALQRRYGRL